MGLLQVRDASIFPRPGPSSLMHALTKPGFLTSTLHTGTQPARRRHLRYGQPLAEIGGIGIDRGTGDDVLKLFTYAREKGFAIPAANVTSSSTAVAALEAARDAKAPIMYDDTTLPPR